MEGARSTAGYSREDRALFPLPRRYLNWIGRWIISIGQMIHGLGAFGLITLGVLVTKRRVAPRMIRPLIRAEIYRAGVRQLPIVSFISAVMGFVIIGQTVSLLNRVGATNYAGLIMVSVVVRELGPLAIALLLLARIGAASVVELGTTRATGEVEALEALGIDPLHYLVAPRLVGLMVSLFALTIYGILIALISGYAFAFVQDVPLQPGQYFSQLAAALSWQDFALLALKTVSFGWLIGVVCCFRGLARPLRLEEVSNATTRAVVETIVCCVALDALFLVVYLMM